MSKTILARQEQILRDILGDSNLQVTRETNATQVDAWDSLTHMQIIAAIEKEFGVRFALGELQALKNVGDMTDLIEKKIS